MLFLAVTSCSGDWANVWPKARVVLLEFRVRTWFEDYEKCLIFDQEKFG